jgi:hypothetical protein
MKASIIRDGKKICSKCKKEKPVDQFHVDKRAKTGRSSACLDCKGLRPLTTEQQRRANKRHDDWVKQDRLLNPEKYVKYGQDFRARHPKWTLLNAARKRAAAKGLTFSITETDIPIPEVCPILGMPIVVNTNGMKDNSISLDRKDVRLGYESGNVQVISVKANAMKNSATPDELRRFARWVINTYGI